MIKRQFFSVIMLLFPVLCMAQFDSQNSLVRKVIVAYEKDANGFYQKKDAALVDKVDNVVSMYAFDKKSSNLYVQTEDGNYVVVLNKEYAKIYKQSKLAPMLDEEQIDAEVQRVSRTLAEHFDALNKTRRQRLTDSIMKVRRDSLERVRRDSIEKATKIAAERQYLASHTWRELPVNNIGMKCIDCGTTVYESSLLCEGIINDTIYYVQPIKGILGYEYQKMHACPVNPRLHSDQQYTYHLKMFADSLAKRQYLSTQYLRAFNAERYAKHSEEVGAKVPNGYVDSWGFDIQEELLMFDFSYTNTNKKGIRHIDVFFNLKDEEGNTRKTGKVRGTGPVEMFETKSWTWSDSNLKVPIGCVDLEITKVAITYKDGKVKTLTKDILYKESE